MKKRLVLYLWGKIALAFAVCMLIPLLMTVFINENRVLEFGIPVLISFTLGILLTKGESPYRGRLSLREGILVTTCGFIFVCLLGALPYVIAGYPVIDALFESTSGFTTTGASVIGDLTVMPLEILLWRSLTQWFGGLAIIIIFVTLVPQVGRDALQLFTAELHGESAERIMPRITKIISLLCYTYIVVTAFITMLFICAGMGSFDAINHAMTVISTGGFSTHNEGFAYFQSNTIDFIAVFFMFLVGTNHILYYKGYKEGIKHILKNTEWCYYVGLICVFTVLIGFNLYYAGDYTKAGDLIHSFFMTVSVLSTTGFSSVNYEAWPDFSKFCLFLLLFIGGCSGSSAGGLKVSRLVILLKMSWEELKRALHPHMVTSITMGGKSVSHSVVNGIFRFFFVYMVVFFVSASLIALTANLSLFSSASFAASCLASVGIGFETLAGSQSYGVLPCSTKLVAIATMLLGRLEIVSLLILFKRDFWESNRLG